MQTTASLFIFLSASTALAACSAPPEGPIPGGAGASKLGDDSRGADTSAAATGQRIYNNTCIACHQQDGKGIPGVYPSLAGSPVLLGDPATLARWVIRGERPAAMPAGRYATQMPQFGWLTPPDAAALFNYLRSSFGNSARPVYADVVAKATAQ